MIRRETPLLPFNPGQGTDTGPSSMTDSGYPRTVREWKRGDKLSESTLVFEGKKEDVSVSGYVSKHLGVVVEWQSRSLVSCVGGGGVAQFSVHVRGVGAQF